jgi:hypothetical protein
VHTGLVKASLSEADQGRIENLGLSIQGRICVGLSAKTMNECSSRQILYGFLLGGSRAGSAVLANLSTRPSIDTDAA